MGGMAIPTAVCRPALAGALLLFSIAVGCGAKKKTPLPVIVSCDLRGAPSSTTATCIDVVDPGFEPRLEPICLSADPSGKRWRRGVACDKAGSLGACEDEGVALTWHYPSAKEKTADDAKKTCRDTETWVAPPARATTPAAPSARATASASPAAALPNLAALLGTKADGWLPKPFAGLKKNMTLAQVTKVKPWANKLDARGSVETAVKDVRGVVKYRLHFVDKQLFTGEIWFDPSLHTAAFRTAFLAAAKPKWGEPKSATDTLVMWFSETSALAKLSDAESGGGYALEVQIAP